VKFSESCETSLHFLYFHLSEFCSSLFDIGESYKSEPIAKYWFGPFLVVVPRNPEDVKIILNSNDCSHKPSVFYGNIFEFGLLVINGEKYKSHRKSVTPSFNAASLKNYLPLLDGVMNQFLINFDVNLNSETFDISHQTVKFVLDSTMATFMNMNDFDEKLRKDLLHNSDT
jgi:cytochrome P450